MPEDQIPTSDQMTPLPAKKPGQKDVSPNKRRWKKALLKEIAECGNIKQACLQAGIDWSEAYKERKIDPAFNAAWEEALEAAVDNLEVEAHRRAAKQSDYLIAMLLRCRRPHKYGEKAAGSQPSATQDPVINISEDEPEAPKA